MAEKNQKKQNIVFLAETNFRNQRLKFGIKKDDRRRHLYLIGKTGMGKSTVMENMLIQDVNNGEGLALVDPHGDFAEKILDYIPANRINDVIYFNPADFDYPIAFNVMESVAQEHKHLIASGLVGVFKKLWADSWGPRLEYVLRNAILALLDYPGSTLLGVMKILVDKNYRNKVVAKIKDPVVKSFWVEEYSRYPQQFQAEAIAPIQNKVGQFLSTTLIRNVVGQVKSTIDLRKIMDEKKILIMNLSKGRLGEDSSALLGAMMITKIQLAAMSRIDIPEETRRDFYLYVDEFQNFATESFANILSEARKYRLDLIIGHQYIEQLDEMVRAAVFGNVGTIMCFRIGAADSEFLAKEFAPYFTEEDLVNLAKYDVYMKLMIDGVASNPFSATTMPPLMTAEKTGNKEKVINVSRERYGKPREVVEDKISRWSGVMEEVEKMASPTEKEERKGKINTFISRRDKREDQKEDYREINKKSFSAAKTTYTVNCYECGKPTEIKFKPDGVRPIYCQKCFQKIREGGLRGKLEETKIAEIIPESQAEISLKEALQKEPVKFKNGPFEQTKIAEKVNLFAEPRQNNEKKIEVKNDDEKEKKNISTNNFKTLEPGKVVKF